MTLLLSNEDVDRLLTMPDVISVMESSYVELAEGRALAGSRADLATVTDAPENVYQLKIMGSTLAAEGVAMLRMVSDILSWPERDGKKRRTKLPLAPGNRWTGLALLFSTHTGEPLAIFPDGAMQRMRVAGTSALGAKYMAREDAASVALIGAGWQAGAQVPAIRAVRDVKEIRCYSPTAERLRTFCDEMEAAHGVPMKPTDSAREAVRGADIVLLATNSMAPIFLKDWIEPGMHFGTIRDGDVEPQAIVAADRVAVHHHSGLEAASHYVTTHGLHIPDQDRDASRRPELAFLKDAPSLADLVTGKAKARTDADQSTCFLNLRGLALQFAAVGALVYRKAREAGLGRDLPTDWFTEDVHP